MNEAKHSKFGVKIDTDEYWRVHDRLPQIDVFGK